MVDPNSVSIAAIGALVSTIAILGWVVKRVLGDSARDLRAHTQAADKQTASNKALQKAVKSMDEYLRERNGRDAEMHKEQIKQSQEVFKGLIDHFDELKKDHAILADKITKIKTQDVVEQHVETQFLGKKK